MSKTMATVGREGLNRFSFNRLKVAIFIGGNAMINCPKCGLECEGEAPREKRPYWLQCECECGFEFAYDTNREEYFNNDGDLIKEKP